MWPLEEGHEFAHNHWYVAAWSDEVTSQEPFEKWILGQPVALYRDEQGRAIALEGRCPHRNYPLAASRIRGDALECGYHGFTFGPDGSCVRIPSQKAIPKQCRVKSFPLVEKWNWIWIWPGDPALADESLIPDHDEIRITSPGWHPVKALTNVLKGRAQLLHENLTDISHLSYLHAGTIGTDAVAETPVEITDNGTFLRGLRRLPNEKLTGFFKDVLGTEGPVNREVLIDFYAPGLHVAWEKFSKPDGEVIAEYRVHHAVTPATATSTNYLIAWSRTFAHDDQTVTDSMNAVFSDIIDQDIFAIEAVERMISLVDEPQELLVKADSHAVRARRKMDALMRAEAQLSQSA